MIDKIKLYIFHPYSDIGGADLSLSRLINNLDGQKYSITFITFKKAIIKKYLKKKIDFKILNVKRALFSILEIRRILTTYDKGYKKKIFISNQNFANIISIFSVLITRLAIIFEALNSSRR